MKFFNLLSGAGVALMVCATLALTPATGFSQTTEVYTPSVTTTRTTTTVTNAPVVNPNDPAQFPPAGSGNPDSHQGKVNAAYVDQQIALAKERGMDTSAAENQEIMGQADLMHGLNDEAAQHFDAALRSVGIMPSWPGHNPGEAESIHHPMP